MSNFNSTKEILQFVCCSLGSKTYALDMSWVISIQHKEHLRYNIKGEEPLGWLNGNIPVINLSSKLGIEKTAGNGEKTQRIIVLKGRSGPWALIFDSVTQVISVPLNSVNLLPSIAANSSPCYFGGVIRLEEKLLLLLSPESINPDASTNVNKLKKKTNGKSIIKSKSAIKHGNRVKQIVIFSVSEQLSREASFYLALSISQVLEILEPLPITPVPGAPYFVQGVISWRGEIVTIVDLCTRLGLSSEDNKQTRSRLVIVRSKVNADEGIYVGFLVEPGVRFLRFPFAATPCRKSIPVNIKLARSVIELGKEILMIPDMQKIISEHTAATTPSKNKSIS